MQQTAIDPFHPLLRMIDRYRQDVHQLQPPSKAGAIEAMRGGLPIPLPPHLESFLARWNGAILFRGALRIRSTAELAAAAESVRNVIVFADGPAPQDRWAFTSDGNGAVIVGKWHESESEEAVGTFEPMHDRFDSWLMATVQILDENHRDSTARLRARLDADPDSGYLLLALADDVIPNNRSEMSIFKASEGLLEQVTSALEDRRVTEHYFSPKAMESLTHAKELAHAMGTFEAMHHKSDGGSGRALLPPLRGGADSSADAEHKSETPADSS